jgi:hypothetical protein
MITSQLHREYWQLLSLCRFGDGSSILKAHGPPINQSHCLSLPNSALVREQDQEQRSSTYCILRVGSKSCLTESTLAIFINFLDTSLK